MYGILQSFSMLRRNRNHFKSAIYYYYYPVIPCFTLLQYDKISLGNASRSKAHISSFTSRANGTFVPLINFMCHFLSQYIGLSAPDILHYFALLNFTPDTNAKLLMQKTITEGSNKKHTLKAGKSRVQYWRGRTARQACQC